MGHNSKASEKPLLTGSALHGCRTPKARMSALFSEDMEILCDNIITVTVQFTFTFIELTSSVPLAELLVETFRQSVEHGPLFKGIWKTTLEGRPPSSVQHAILSLCSGTVLTHWSTLNNPQLSLAVIGVPSHATAVLYCCSILRKYTKGEFTLIWSTE